MELLLDKLTDDKERIGLIISGLKRKNGYCPCSREMDDDHKCPCLDYRTTGECHCKLYKE